MFLGKIKENSAVKMAKGFLNRIKEDHVGAYAAQTAYFLIMSFIPLVLFLATAVRYTPPYLYADPPGYYWDCPGKPAGLCA